MTHPRLSAEEFDEAVDQALALIPAPLRAELTNVAIFVEDEPPEDEEGLLGIYEGVPLPERDDWGSPLPDRITLYQGPLERMCHSRAEVLDQIAVTLVHEVAHYFGIEEGRLHELGWG